MKTKKSEARQILIGKCGHKITRVKWGKTMAWYCYEGTTDQCGSQAEFAYIKLQARGKAK